MFAIATISMLLRRECVGGSKKGLPLLDYSILRGKLVYRGGVCVVNVCRGRIERKRRRKQREEK